MVLYPIHLHSLASFRQPSFQARAKDNRIDSQLLEELIRTHSDRLRPYQPQSTTERKLDQYCRIATVCYPQTALLHWSRAVGLGRDPPQANKPARGRESSGYRAAPPGGFPDRSCVAGNLGLVGSFPKGGMH